MPHTHSQTEMNRNEVSLSSSMLCHITVLGVTDHHGPVRTFYCCSGRFAAKMKQGLNAEAALKDSSSALTYVSKVIFVTANRMINMYFNTALNTWLYLIICTSMCMCIQKQASVSGNQLAVALAAVENGCLLCQ